MVDIEKGLMIEANQFLIESVFTNLIANAIRHSDNAAFIQVRLNSEQFLISNPGSNQLNKDFIFERFKHSSQSENGSGLGLSIVNEICKSYEWRLNYTFTDSSHNFQIDF